MTVKDKVSYLSGRYVNSDLQYTQANYFEIAKEKKSQEELVAWKNDKVNTQISLSSNRALVQDIDIKFGRFENEEGEKFDGIFEYYFIDSTQAYSIKPNPTVFNDNNYPPEGYRKEANEILSNRLKTTLLPESILNIWIDVETNKNTTPGVYTGNIYVNTNLKEEVLTFSLTIEVLDMELPDIESEKDFDIEFWQNPYAVAEYYDVEVFSEEHFEILKTHMQSYKKLGAQAITATIVDEAWDGQTYSKRDIKYPSMIKWIKKADGSFEFDYEHFDKWVDFNLNLGIGKKISCYSVVPWNNKVRYYDEKEQKWVDVSYEIGDELYLELWEPFLKDFIAHVTNNGWFDNVYIGIDERGFHQAAFDLVKRFENEDGKTLKISGALDNLKEQGHWADYIDDLTMGTVPIKEAPDVFFEFCESRREKGLKTTVYSCTGHVPGNFALSAPGESFWTILFSYFAGADGFLRWAYDSWVESPLTDTTHSLFEAGDCFLIYPGTLGEEIPEPQLSTRLQKMLEGIRTVHKLKRLVELDSTLAEEINELKNYIQPIYSNKEYYLDRDGELELAVDMEKIRSKITHLTKKIANEKNRETVSSY